MRIEKVEAVDVIAFTITIACIVLIAVFKEQQAWGALLAVIAAYLVKKRNGNGAPPPPVKRKQTRKPRQPRSRADE